MKLHNVKRVLRGKRSWAVVHANCRRVLAALPDASIDAVITDPPYPEIRRDYGRLTERQWHRLMREVVTETRRVLTPTGSAVFILQPNQEHVGRTRPWLWEFMAWTAREWNMVQDVWWWNTSAPPVVCCNRKVGLLRPSVKACVWLGPANCYRHQDAVLWSESKSNAKVRAVMRARVDRLTYKPSGVTMRHGRCAEVAAERGGVIPFNLLPIPNSNAVDSGGAYGHGAATPMALCNWWVRYIVPPKGIVLDPFCGSGTVGRACLAHKRRFIGSEQQREYVALSRRLLAAIPAPLFGG
jgi:DNA modification methylase